MNPDDLRAVATYMGGLERYIMLLGITSRPLPLPHTLNPASIESPLYGSGPGCLVDAGGLLVYIYWSWDRPDRLWAKRPAIEWEESGWTASPSS